MYLSLVPDMLQMVFGVDKTISDVGRRVRWGNEEGEEQWIGAAIQSKNNG